MTASSTDAALGVHAAGLTKRFDSTLALDGFDVAVEGPLVFGIVGPDGAG